MSVAVLPFTVMEREIVDKEVKNGYYHPIAYQVAQGMATIPAAFLLSLLTSLIVVGMVGLSEPFWYFLNMFLALFVSEGLAQLVSHVVPHFVIGMALLAGLFGFFMLFMGFMLVPSDFPNWLRWTYYIGFHTYSWRSFMYGEFKGAVFDPLESGNPFPTGDEVLEFYDILDVHRGNDVSDLGCKPIMLYSSNLISLSFSILRFSQMVVLLFYGLIIHFMSFIVLHIRYTMFKGKITLPDGPNKTPPTIREESENQDPWK